MYCAEGQARVALEQEKLEFCRLVPAFLSMFARVCWVYRANTFNDGLYPVLAQLNHSCLPN